MGKIRDFFYGVEEEVEETKQFADSGILPPSRVAQPVSTNDAMSLTSVYRAVQILTTVMSQLDVAVYRGTERIPTPALILKPDADIPLSTFTKRTVTSLATNGNAYWRIFRRQDGTVASLEVLNPLAVNIMYDKQGRKQYAYSGNASNQVFKDSQVKHLKLMEMPGYDYGLGPIQACKTTIRGAVDLREYADNWFDNSGVPSGVLTSDQYLESQEVAEYQQAWFSMLDNRSVAVLGKGLEYRPIMLKPSDAQFLETQQFSVTEISRLFGIPANYLLATVEGNSMTYSNLTQVNKDFIQNTLQTYITEIENALTDLIPRGNTVKVQLDSLLRNDDKTRAETYKMYLEMGVLTVEEIREKEGLPNK